MATILTKKKDTTGAPVAGDLTNSTGGAELAVNTADKRLYTKDSGGNVVEVGTNPGTAVTFTAGTVSAPAITTTGDTNTGVFFPAADTIAFAEGGAEAMRINSDSQVVTTAGTASLPAITTTGDVNTGIFFPAADTIAFAEGGAEAMRIDSSGNVGIGVTPNAWEPTYGKALQLNNRGAALFSPTTSWTSAFTLYAFNNSYIASDGNYKYASTGAAGFLNIANDNLIFSNAGSGTAGNTITWAERMRIDSSGNVLVGDTSADYSASGRGNIEINGSSNSILALKIGAAPASYFYASASDLSIVNTLSGLIGFYTNSVERARITSGGDFLFKTTDASFTTGVGFKILSGATGAPACTATVVDSASGTAVTNYHHYNVNATFNGYRFYVNNNGGISNFSANNVNLSDERVKTNIELSGSYLTKICSIPVKLFNYKDEPNNEQKSLGVIAQDVEAVAPELVNNDGWLGKEQEDGVPLKSVYETDMMFALMKSIQELKAITDAQATRIEALEAEVVALKGQ